MKNIMQKYEKMIESILSSSDVFDISDNGYVEIVENLAIKLFNLVYDDGTINKLTTFVKLENKNMKKYTLSSYEIEFADTDSIDDFINGNISYHGDCKILNFSGYFMMNLEIKNFKIYSLWASSPSEDIEIPFIEKGKYVLETRREYVQLTNQSKGAKYTYSYGENI